MHSFNRSCQDTLWSGCTCAYPIGEECMFPLFCIPSVLGFVKFIYLFLPIWWVWNCSIVFICSPLIAISKVQYLSFVCWSFRFFSLELLFLGLCSFFWGGACLLAFSLPLSLSFLLASLPSYVTLSSFSFIFLSFLSPLFLPSLTFSLPPLTFFLSDCQGFVIRAFINPSVCDLFLILRIVLLVNQSIKFLYTQV